MLLKKDLKYIWNNHILLKLKLKEMGPFIEVKADCGIDEVFQKIVEQLDAKLK